MKIAIYLGLSLLALIAITIEVGGWVWWLIGKTVRHWYDESTEPGRCGFGHDGRR
jgi:hypothetical protein